jgi:hypothetical protein
VLKIEEKGWPQGLGLSLVELFAPPPAKGEAGWGSVLCYKIGRRILNLINNQTIHLTDLAVELGRPKSLLRVPSGRGFSRVKADIV